MGLAAQIGVTSGNAKGVLTGFGFILSAVLMWVVVRAVDGKVIDKPKLVTDPDTGEQLWTRPRSTLFLIPLKYLPFALAGLGLLILVLGAVAMAIGIEPNLREPSA